MTKDIAYYQNRIELMSGRTDRENANIIKKCKRKIRALQAE